MGQHKHNPTAIAAKRGELAPRAGRREPSIGSRFGGPITDDRDVKTTRGLRRKFPKVKGKANVKRAKQARRLARESAARLKAA